MVDFFCKDWNGKVLEVKKYNEGKEYTSSVTYDRLGNQVRVIDGKRQIYDFVYNDLNQTIKEIMPETEVILPGGILLSSYRPEVSYEYDKLGRKSVEVNPNGNATSKVGDNRVDYEYDNSGRLIKTVINKFDQNLVTKNYYDSIGNVIKSVDPEGRMVQQYYHPRGWVLAEVGPMGHVVYHQYNELGKEIAVIDPRGVVEESEADFDGINVEILGTTYRINPDYTTKVEYDSLARQIKATDLMGNTTEIQYNRVGAKLFVTQTPDEYDVNSSLRITEYIYTPQYWVESVTTGDGENLEHTTVYKYDKVGNKTKEIYPDIKDQSAGSNYLTYEYDDLNRLEKVIRPDGSSEKYGYDEIGNQTSVINGRNFETIYYYNGLNQLSEVVELTGSRTYYRYDPNGNLVQKELANGLITDYVYNDLNLMVEEIRVRAQDVMSYKMAYDGSGNLLTSSDPRGNLTGISYFDNGSIKEQVFYAPLDEESVVIPDLTNVNVETVPIGYEEDERISYQYDQIGNLTEVKDGLGSVNYTYDRLSQISLEKRLIDQKSYETQYEYDFAGNVVKIKNPESDEWVKYQYNELNQLKNVEGYLDDLIYDSAGNLNEIQYSNDSVTEITSDIMSRPDRITVKSEKESHYALDLNYVYDANGNVNLRNKNIYTYDELDRLKTAEVDGTFLVDAPGRNGYVANDYFVDSTLDYEIQDIKVDFDYAASTVGIQLDSIQKVGRIELIPEALENRVSEHGIRIFYRQYTNEGYTELSSDQVVVNKSSTGKLIILLKSTVRAWEIKIHSNYDDRDIETGETINVAEFSNDLNKMIRVYGRYDRTKIEYDYDSVGNRIKETYTDLNYHYDVSYSYDYYDGSNRLKSRESQEVEDWSPLTDNVDGFMKIGVGDKKAYQYDKAGNMTAKGNSYSFNGNGVDYSEVDGENIAYWKYGYNSKNRLTDVWKNGGDEGSHIAKYGYDYRGLRVRVEEGDAVSYHVYNYFGQLVYEEQGDEETFYIYALGRVIAKREGKSGEEEKVYYYHHDNLGSTVLMIDTEGEVVFEQEYAPFGQDLHKAGTYEKSPYDVEAGMKYTGQIADVDTGLYYYNARYYDPEIGRFNREDEYHGDVFRPQGLNPYVYVLNNALKYVDPSGNIGINISSTDGGGIATEEDAREFEDYWNSVFKPEEFFGYDKTALEIYKDKILNRFVEFENTAALIDEWFVRHNKTPTGYWWNEGYSNDEAVDFEWIGGGFRIIVNVVVFEGKADIITFNSKHLDKYTLSHFDTNSFIILSSNHGISSGQVEVFTGDILKSLKKQGIKIKDLLNHKPLMAKSLKNALGSSASINLIGISKEVNTPPISLKDYIDTSHNILNISANVLNFRVSLDYSDKLEIEGVGWVWKPVPVVLDINNTSKMYHWIIPILVEED